MERMIVLSKDLNSRSAQSTEKKVMKILEASRPMVSVSEEVEVLVDDVREKDMKALRDFAEKEGYEMEVIE